MATLSTASAGKRESTALDPKSGDRIVRLTDEIMRQVKLRTMMVTHLMRWADQFGESAAEMLHLQYV